MIHPLKSSYILGSLSDTTLDGETQELGPPKHELDDVVHVEINCNCVK